MSSSLPCIECGTFAMPRGRFLYCSQRCSLISRSRRWDEYIAKKHKKDPPAPPSWYLEPEKRERLR